MSDNETPNLGAMDSWPDEPDLGAPESADGPEASAPKAVPPARRDTQWSIVKHQFVKHRAAVWGLRATIVLVLVAIYAPLLASAQPFMYRAGPDSDLTYPWFTTLLDGSVWEHILDRIFNIAMIAVAVFALGRVILALTKAGADTKRVWRKALVLVTVGFCLAHAFFGVALSKSPSTEFRTTIDALKNAEDEVVAAPIGERFRATLATERTNFATLYEAAGSANRELQALKSRAASRVLRPLADLRQTMGATAGEIDLVLQRAARSAGLLKSELDLLEGGSDTTLDTSLRDAWDGPDGAAEADLDPATRIERKANRLAYVPGPAANQLREQLTQLSDRVRDQLSEAVDAFDRTMTRADLPSLAEAKDRLTKAQAARDAATILYPPIPYGYREQLSQGYDSFRPSADFARGERHLLGTDQTGRDVMARILFGTRISLTIGLFAVSIYVTIGTILGALAGYFRGWVDMLIMRAVEILICIPGLFLILTIVALFDQKSIWLIMFAIAIVSWTGITRLVRGEFLRERNSEYVLAAQAMGYSTPRIIFRHVLPNSIGPVLVSATFGIAAAILTESGLSFLGLGDVSVPSWGGVLDEGRRNSMWHMIIPPSVAIFITVTALNLVGDGVRDALDPKLRN